MTMQSVITPYLLKYERKESSSVFGLSPPMNSFRKCSAWS